MRFVSVPSLFSPSAVSSRAPGFAVAAALGATCLALSCATAPAPAPAAGPAAAAAPAPVPTPDPTVPGVGRPEKIPSTIPFQSLEGPYWVGKGGFLLFSDVVEQNAPGAHIYRFDPATAAFSVFPYPPPEPGSAATSTNGLGFDPQERLLATERYNGRVVRVEPDGKRTILAARWPVSDGPALNAPNDLVVRSDGNIYFTDTDWGAAPVAHPLSGVYRIAPDGAVSLVTSFVKPNGIALSPDGNTLYLGSDTQAKVWSFPVAADGSVGSPQTFVDGATVAGGFKVPDGICVDDSGNIYVPNNDDDIKAIVAFDPSGRQLGRIPLPDKPSNCTFGGPDRRTLYVTTLHAVYRVAMPTPGLP